MKNRFARYWVRAAALVTLLVSRWVVFGDTWLPPTEFDSFSEDKKFVARVIPAESAGKAVVIVSSLENNQRKESWRAELSNPVSPTRVFVSADGDSVVTMDNWGRGGYGDDVIAVYGRKGQLAKYSLEQFAPLPPAEPRGLASFRFGDGGYESKFPHSTSSRQWSADSFQFFFQEAGQSLFVLWLDWDDRWVALDLSDGKLLKVSEDQTKRWNAEGRQRAIAECRSGKATEEGLNFLGKRRNKADRHFVEAWLNDSEFGFGKVQRSVSGNPSFFAYTAQSYKRQAADRILARWDGLSGRESGRFDYERYYFLATLECSVDLQVAPQLNDGSIYIYLLPETTPTNNWSASRPEHYLRAEFNYFLPSFRNGELVETAPGRTLNFVVSGITPGR